MKAFFDEIRQDRIQLADVMDKHRGIRKIVEELYPDKAHFIYELLQNAEDTGASEIEFVLSDKELRFNHNGRPFDEADIESITDIGESSKQDKEDKIGRFGIGFKAVFAYTETPMIFSNNINFRIERLVVPEIIEPSASNRNGTTFVFPFNNPKKSAIKAFSEIKEGLELLNEQLLIFLQNIKLIKWKVNGGEQFELTREEHTVNHIEVIKYKKNVKISFSHWLRFSEKIPNKAVLNVSIAYPLTFLKKINEPLFNDKLAISEQFEIKPISGSVSVYFPAEKEVSGLKFNIHAPFIPELSRASIKDTEANLPLYDLLALLTSSSLNSIKSLGLLNQTFLAVLPNLGDVIPQRYLPILNSVHEALKNSPLVPTFEGGFKKASLLYQSKLGFKKLFTSNDLRYFVAGADKKVEWAIGVNQKNGRQDKLLSNIGVGKWDVDELVEFISEHGEKEVSNWSGSETNDKFDNFEKWIKSKSNYWLGNFYSLLYKELESDYRIDEIEGASLIKTQSNNFLKGNECFYPSSVGVNDDLTPRVNNELLSQFEGTNTSQDINKFLEELGVNTYGNKEEVKKILNDIYSDSHEGIPWDEHISHINKFIEFENQNRNEINLFKGYKFICNENKTPTLYRQLFLDSAFTGLELESYFQCLNNISKTEAFPISYEYVCDSIDIVKFVDFLKRLGVRHSLQLVKTTCRENKESTFLYGSLGKWMDTRIDRDYFIPDLDTFFENLTIEKALLVWDLLKRTRAVHLIAFHRSNKSNRGRKADSKFIQILKSKEWIPNKDGSFVKPCDAIKNDTVDEFSIFLPTEWSNSIGLFSKERAKSHDVQNKISHAKELGLSVDSEEDIDEMKAFLSLSKEKRSAFLRAEQNSNIEDFELPENTPGNPELRAERVKELASEAPDRVAEVRERSVQVGVNKVKAEAAEYLINQYTNDDGKMICQICQDELPFKDLKNDYYFEKVEFLKGIEGRHYQNYLSLCPNHSAMFVHSNKSKADIYEAFLSFESDEFEVTLANESAYIYFTKTHIIDLKAVLGIDDEQPIENIPSTPSVDKLEPSQAKISNPLNSISIETKGKYIYFLGVELSKEKINWKKAYLYPDSEMKWCLSAKANVVTQFDSKDAAEYWWSSFNKERGINDIKLNMSKPEGKKVMQTLVPKIPSKNKKKKRKITSVSTPTSTSYGYSSGKGICTICDGTGGGGGNCYKCDGTGWA